MKALFSQAGLEINDSQLGKFNKFYELLISENEKYNLTAITEFNEVVIKHFIDSVLIFNLDFKFENTKIIDIGTGAGFPAIPLKIMDESIEITALDSLNKRINFIELVKKDLDITHLDAVHGRAEDFGQSPIYREKYDFAVSRAVAELRLLLEFVMPFVKVNGYFLAYKSLKSDQELIDAKNALEKMKAKIVDIKTIQLPENMGTREIIIIQKTGVLDKKYPRKPGIPKKSPL